MTHDPGASPRHTLARPSAWLRGMGLHSGLDAAIRFAPAAPLSGLVFRRIPDGQEIPALISNIADTTRCTQLESGGARLGTVEHALSALSGMGVDDAVIEFEGVEAPAADGSAAPFASLIAEAGLVEQPVGLSRPIVLTAPVLAQMGSSTILAIPSDRPSYTVALHYPRHRYIGTMAYRHDPRVQSYQAEVAPARTFGFLAELEQLRAQGLALGATRENAIALGDDGYETEPRFPDELARHKLLDLIGDLVLIGRPVCCEIVAIKPSHALNALFAQLLAQEASGNHVR